MHPALITRPPMATSFVVYEILSRDIWPKGEEVVTAKGSLFIESRIPDYGEIEVEDYVYTFEVPDMDDVTEGYEIRFDPAREMES